MKAESRIHRAGNAREKELKSGATPPAVVVCPLMSDDKVLLADYTSPHSVEEYSMFGANLSIKYSL
jgi:hypothetical protein